MSKKAATPRVNPDATIELRNHQDFGVRIGDKVDSGEVVGFTDAGGFVVRFPDNFCLTYSPNEIHLTGAAGIRRGPRTFRVG
jgi:hypothetical protein